MIQFDSERARRAAWLVLWLYIAGLGISAVLRNQGDFFVYYRTGHRVLHGIAIYPPGESDRFLYAPIFAIAFAPFALVPRHAAQGLWFIVNAWGLVAFIIGANVMLFGRARRLSAPLMAVPILLSIRFIGNNFEHGQINLPVLALCTWAVVYAREERPVWSGGMLAAAILIKPFALLAALYLAIRRYWAVLGWAVGGGLVLFLLPILVFGPTGLIEQTAAYVHSVVSMTDRYRTMLTNQSAVAAVARIASRFGGEAAANGPMPFWLGMGLEALLIAMVSAWMLATPASEQHKADRYALAALFSLMAGFAPISWKSYFAAMVIPYMLLTGELIEDRRKSPAAWVLLAVSVLVNFIPGRHPSRIALFYSANLLSSLLVLTAVGVLWRKDDRTPMASLPDSVQADRAG
jgi:hypothetical protein